MGWVAFVLEIIYMDRQDGQDAFGMGADVLLGDWGYGERFWMESFI